MSVKRAARRYNKDYNYYGNDQKWLVGIGKYFVECHASRNPHSGTWRAYIKIEIEGFKGNEYVPWDQYNGDPYDDIVHGGITCMFGDDWGMDCHHVDDYAPLEPLTHKEGRRYWNFPDVKKEVIKMVWLAYGPHVSIVDLAKFENCYAEAIGDSCRPDRCWMFEADPDTSDRPASSPSVPDTGDNSIRN